MKISIKENNYIEDQKGVVSRETITKVDLPCCCSQKHRQALQPGMIRAESQRDSGSPEKREQVTLILLYWSSVFSLMEEVRNGILSSS